MKPHLKYAITLVSAFYFQTGFCSPDLTFNESSENHESRYVLSNYTGWDQTQSTPYSLVRSVMRIDWSSRKINSQVILTGSSLRNLLDSQSIQDTCNRVFEWTVAGIEYVALGPNSTLSDRFSDSDYLQRFPNAYQYSFSNLAWVEGQAHTGSSESKLSCEGRL